ncbi:phage tail sheath C-terminal domain-containing protein [Crocosphaera sp.]|uniref:phage tail sheath family protein n=1 Tax=Crocosphaera sp. TaxID=2729996 RepID=UPI0026072DC7|nr:phage tail sheath C-terminal domain-containing protein [Crocosphaera sp.]MDJ0582131.1 phage tail sheath C-terminal domain-containing protein [Crocosphaera sp.]
MPITPTYPGVYIEEIPSGVRTITGVATSITAFLGFADRGPSNDPVRIQNFGDFERLFGGLSLKSTMSFAVQQYFLNGGTDAIIVRLEPPNAESATINLDSSGTAVVLKASSAGTWGNGLEVSVDHDTADTPETPETDKTFNLTIVLKQGTQEITRETIRNLSMNSTAIRYIKEILETQSFLVRFESGGSDRPNPTPTPSDENPNPSAKATGGSDGDAVDGDNSPQIYQGSESEKTGIFALEKADLFNLLCIPPVSSGIDIDPSVWSAALVYCEKRRAMLLVDPPSDWDSKDDVTRNLSEFLAGWSEKQNGAIFFPRIKLQNPLKENRLETFAPSAAMAGIFSRTDANRGVWKAPAGIDATLTGVRELTVKLTDGENGILNPLGVNCLRNFPVYGNVVWGSRTLEGDDRFASEWKYIPIRRLTLFLQESLYRGTQWVVFEPNDEPLWAQIRLNLGAFMNNLFRQGAFQGDTPSKAYFVKCDKETNPQNDIDRGIVNIIVGFAPLKPAEFVIIKFQQIAGDIAT